MFKDLSLRPPKNSDGVRRVLRDTSAPDVESPFAFRDTTILRNFSKLVLVSRSHGRRKDFFQEGGTRGFFLGRLKVVKFGFSHSKLRKQPFFAEIFKIQGALTPFPLPTPMAAVYQSCCLCRQILKHMQLRLKNSMMQITQFVCRGGDSA